MSDKENEKQEETESQAGFKVSDRRLFTPEGELRTPDSPPDEPLRPAPQPVSDRTREAERPRPEPPPPDQDELGPGGEEMSFSSFLLSLATSAMVHLGEIADPATGRRSNNIEAGKQMIEILSILEEKTRGNLAPDEKQLIENILYELRLKYLSRSKAIKL